MGLSRINFSKLMIGIGQKIVEIKSTNSVVIIMQVGINAIMMMAMLGFWM